MLGVRLIFTAFIRNRISVIRKLTSQVVAYLALEVVKI